MRYRLLAVILWLGLPIVPAAAQMDVIAPTVQNTGAYYVAADTLNVRFGPSVDTEVAKRLQRGEKVFVFEARDGWARISKPFSGKNVGLQGMVAYWVSMRYLARDKPEGQ